MSEARARVGLGDAALRASALVHTYAGNPLDRASAKRADAEWLAAARADPRARFVAFADLKPLVRPGPERGTPAALIWLSAEEAPEAALGRPVFLGLEGGAPRFAIDLGAEAGPRKGGKYIDLRGITPDLAAPDAAILAQAKAILDWNRGRAFCSVCGGRNRVVEGGWRRDCEACGAPHFPRTDPVVIMLIHRGGHCLLGRSARFPEGLFSCLAGFVEAGETIEEAVAREVDEEVGVKVGAVAYHSSQPWPYPMSLMIGCFGEAETDEITLDPAELVEARWLARAEAASALRGEAGFVMPARLSIAHQLIRAWVEMG